ncbi:unnamed protein product, partial [Trichogramma brassicae]
IVPPAQNQNGMDGELQTRQHQNILDDEVPPAQNQNGMDGELQTRQHQNILDDEVPPAQNQNGMDGELQTRQHQNIFDDEVPPAQNQNGMDGELQTREHQNIFDDQVPRGQERNNLAQVAYNVILPEIEPVLRPRHSLSFIARVVYVCVCNKPRTARNHTILNVLPCSSLGCEKTRLDATFLVLPRKIVEYRYIGTDICTRIMVADIKHLCRTAAVPRRIFRFKTRSMEKKARARVQASRGYGKQLVKSLERANEDGSREMMTISVCCSDYLHSRLAFTIQRTFSIIERLLSSTKVGCFVNAPMDSLLRASQRVECQILSSNSRSARRKRKSLECRDRRDTHNSKLAATINLAPIRYYTLATLCTRLANDLSAIHPLLQQLHTYTYTGGHIGESPFDSGSWAKDPFQPTAPAPSVLPWQATSARGHSRTNRARQREKYIRQWLVLVPRRTQLMRRSQLNIALPPARPRVWSSSADTRHEILDAPRDRLPKPESKLLHPRVGQVTSSNSSSSPSRNLSSDTQLKLRNEHRKLHARHIPFPARRVFATIYGSRQLSSQLSRRLYHILAGGNSLLHLLDCCCCCYCTTRYVSYYDVCRLLLHAYIQSDVLRSHCILAESQTASCPPTAPAKRRIIRQSEAAAYTSIVFTRTLEQLLFLLSASFAIHSRGAHSLRAPLSLRRACDFSFTQRVELSNLARHPRSHSTFKSSIFCV